MFQLCTRLLELQSIGPLTEEAEREVLLSLQATANAIVIPDATVAAVSSANPVNSQASTSSVIPVLPVTAPNPAPATTQAQRPATALAPRHPTVHFDDMPVAPVAPFPPALLVQQKEEKEPGPPASTEVDDDQMVVEAQHEIKGVADDCEVVPMDMDVVVVSSEASSDNDSIVPDLSVAAQTSRSIAPAENTVIDVFSAAPKKSPGILATATSTLASVLASLVSGGGSTTKSSGPHTLAPVRSPSSFMKASDIGIANAPPRQSPYALAASDEAAEKENQPRVIPSSQPLDDGVEV